MAAVNPMYQWLAIDIIRAGPRQASFAMTVTDQHANTFGVCHGGIIFAFADLAMGFTCNALGERAVTANASMEFLNAVPIGARLVADVEQTAINGRNAFYAVKLHTEEAPADVTGILHGRMRIVGGALPAQDSAQPVAAKSK